MSNNDLKSYKVSRATFTSGSYVNSILNSPNLDNYLDLKFKFLSIILYKFITVHNVNYLANQSMLKVSSKHV